MYIDETRNPKTGTPYVEGNWLYNAKDKVISDFIYLGIEADASDWVEITQEQKEILEAQWVSEMDNGLNTDIPEETLMKAQAYDIITGGAE